MTQYPSRLLLVSFAVAAIATSFAPLHASPVFAHYRGVTLGDSLATVKTHLGAEPTTITVLHEKPSLIQELAWRPQRFISGVTVTPDPLSEMVLTFHQDRLVRIVAIYDRDKTRGLTDADMLELITSIYGPALLPSGVAVVNPKDPRKQIGTWSDINTRVVLWSEEHPRRLGLTISADGDAARLDEAAASGAALVAAAEPLRRRLLEEAAAAAIVDREAKIRAENKAKFKP